MKIESRIQVERPLQEVWEWTDDPDNLAKWQKGFERYELISGELGEVGMVAHQHYKEGKREFYLRETLLEKQAPNHARLELHHKTMTSIIDMDLIATNENSTEVSCLCAIELRGIWKILGPLMRKTFQKRQDEGFEMMKEAVEAGG